MSPLYFNNGKLLIVNGSLATNENCCCEEDNCLLPRCNGIFFLFVTSTCDQEPEYPLDPFEINIYDNIWLVYNDLFGTYYTAFPEPDLLINKWPCEVILPNVGVDDNEKKYLYFVYSSECNPSCGEGTCDIKIRIEMSCSGIYLPNPPTQELWDKCTLGPLEYYDSSTQTWSTDNNPTADCDCPGQFVTFYYSYNQQSSEEALADFQNSAYLLGRPLCALACTETGYKYIQASSVEECQKWYFPSYEIYNGPYEDYFENFDKVVFNPNPDAMLGGCCTDTTPCFINSCSSTWTASNGWDLLDDCATRQPPAYPLGPCVCNLPGPGDPDPPFDEEGNPDTENFPPEWGGVVQIISWDPSSQVLELQGQCGDNVFP